MPEEIDVTELLRQAANGDEAAHARVVEWAYGELKQLARSRLRNRRRGGPATLEPAALVNETFLKMLQEPKEFANRRHLLAFASTVMLRVLIDYQRERKAQKRGGDAVQVTLSDLGSGHEDGVDMIDLKRALDALEELDARKAEVVKLRLLWGHEMPDIAKLIDVSLATVERDWRFARAWIADSLAK